MAAGNSASEVARKQREKAARLQRSADLWERGAQGEAEVARVLEELPQGWEVLHDLPWPGRSRANIDHVAIGPGGAFVIDAKNWSGKVEVRNQALSQNGRSREKAVNSAHEASAALQAFLPVPTACSAVLCFVTEDSISGQAGDVVVCSTDNLVATLLSRPPVLHREGIRLSVDAIRQNCVRPVQARPALGKVKAKPAGTRAPQRPRQQRRGTGRAVRGLVALVLLATLLYSGGLEKGAQWFGKQFVELAVTNDQVPGPPPVEKPKKPKKNREKAR